MLKKTYRLTRRNDFRRVYGKGKSAANYSMVLYVAPSRNQAMRIGFSVSKKIGKAVVRNRVKRLMREAAFHLLDSFDQHKDYVFIARGGIKEKSLAEIERQMTSLLKRINETKPAKKS